MGSSYRRLEVQLPQFWRVDLATAEDEERKATELKGEVTRARDAAEQAKNGRKQRYDALKPNGEPVRLTQLESFIRKFWKEQSSADGMSKEEVVAFAEKMVGPAPKSGSKPPKKGVGFAASPGPGTLPDSHSSPAPPHGMPPPPPPLHSARHADGAAY